MDTLSRDIEWRHGMETLSGDIEWRHGVDTLRRNKNFLIVIHSHVHYLKLV